MPAKAECRRLTLVLLLSFAIAARGAQSVENCPAPASCTVYCSCDSDSYFHSSSGFDQADDTYNPYLARIGKELLDPPDEAADWNTLPVRSLPGVPAAIFMVLTGFLCVSFVNDRRIWLASLAGLLWLGQTGLSAIPQVASHLAGKNNVTQNHPHNFVGVGKARYRNRLRSDIEGTQYIGLLRHLAGIPSMVSSSIPASISSLRTWRSYRHVAESAYSARPEFAIAQAPSETSNSTVCLARIAEHFVLFSPAFAFSSLARGPPQCL